MAARSIFLARIGGTGLAFSAARASLLVAVICSLSYPLAVSGGQPLLRQDWDVSPFLIDWHIAVTNAFSSWVVPGIGSMVPYPNAYAISVPILLMSAFFGGQAALFVYLAGVNALVAFAARAIALDARCSVAGVSAAIVLAVFNPWVYTELVAGHLLMLLAYASSLWLLRELLSANPSADVLTLAALGTLEQIQFFVITTVLLTPFAMVRRQWTPLIVVGLCWIPIIIGLIFESSSIGRILVTVDWERGQSLLPVDAVQLNGYFAHYGESFRNIFATAVFTTFTVALVALARGGSRVLVIAIGTLLALLFSMGTRGPLAGAVGWSFDHVRATALFRELFDILGYVAIGYVMLAAAACGRWRWGGWIWLLTALLLPIVWITSPPERFWVAARTLPHVSVPLIPNTRFALAPAFQPMSFAGHGAGQDPDAYPRVDNVTPLNVYLASYPIDAALGAFAIRGDVRALEALSVSSVTERPWLQTQARSLEMQWALPFDGFPRGESLRSRRLHPAPELALMPLPNVGALDRHVGSGDIFFGDAARAQGALVPGSWRRFEPVIPILAQTSALHASTGWVDARLTFAQRPDLAQALGGALTTNAIAGLPLRGRLSALVFVAGALRANDRRIIATTTYGYRWIAVPAGVTHVTCSGLCVVAAQGNPPAVPLEPPAHAPSGIAFKQILPWLATAVVPPGALGALRYNVAYDDRWGAFLAARPLTHVRLDGVINGWLIPPRRQPESLVLIETTAAAQFLAEVFALAVVGGLGFLYLARCLKRRDT